MQASLQKYSAAGEPECVDLAPKCVFGSLGSLVSSPLGLVPGHLIFVY